MELFPSMFHMEAQSPTHVMMDLNLLETVWVFAGMEFGVFLNQSAVSGHNCIHMSCNNYRMHYIYMCMYYTIIQKFYLGTYVHKLHTQGNLVVYNLLSSCIHVCTYLRII